MPFKISQNILMRNMPNCCGLFSDAEYIHHISLIRGYGNFTSGQIRGQAEKILYMVNQSAINILNFVKTKFPLCDPKGQIITEQTQIEELATLSNCLQIITSTIQEQMSHYAIVWPSCIRECTKISKVAAQMKAWAEKLAEELRHDQILRENRPMVSDILAPMPDVQVDLIMHYI